MRLFTLLAALSLSLLLDAVKIVASRLTLALEPPAEVRPNGHALPVTEGRTPLRKSRAPQPAHTPTPYLIEPPFE